MNAPFHYQTLEQACVRRLLARWVEGRATPLRVLDYGCGRGKYLDLFVGLGCSVTAVDANPEYVADARAKGIDACAADEFLASNARQFDVVFLGHVIEHLDPQPLMALITQLCGMLVKSGRLIIITPIPGERFFHDFTHVRPYLPQSIRHAFGQTGAPIGLGERRLLELVDIHFFRDPYRTRLWRSFYLGHPATMTATRALNKLFDAAWGLSGGRLGTVASWLGVYVLSAGANAT